MKKIKEMFSSVQSRYGTYSTILTVVMIAVVIMINLVAGQMPESWKNIDLSSNNLYEITDQSRNLLKTVDKDITIHVLADKSEADERIKTFIEKYASLSNHLTVKWTDPVLHPSVLTEYNASSDTIVVECADTGRQTQIAFTDMITFDEMSYYYYGSYVEDSFDAEGQLTSAVNYVVNDTTQKIYATTGHGEMSLESNITDLMDKSNFTVEELNTMLDSEIPEDCDLLFLYAPTADLTEDELTAVLAYMQEGGDVIFILGDTEKETKNLNALLAEYGMEKVDGYIADTARCYQGNPYYIFPELSVSDEMATGIESEMVLLINSLGLNVTDPARDTITVETFMSTTSSGHAVTEDKDEQGTYTLGAIATEEDCRFTVITSYTMIDSYLTESFPTLDNTTLFMNAVSANFEQVSNIAIEAKSLEVTYNTMQYTGISGLVAIIGIPIFILIYGFVKWLKRRKA